MSLSHYFELTPERYMRTYYGFPTFYKCTNPPVCSSDSDFLELQPPCINHMQYMTDFSIYNTFLNK